MTDPAVTQAKHFELWMAIKQNPEDGDNKTKHYNLPTSMVDLKEEVTISSGRDKLTDDPSPKLLKNL